MIVRAHLRYLRIAPRKVRLVVNLVRGLAVDRALDQLSVLPKHSAGPVAKLIKSAVANATHNHHLDQKTLKVQSIVANEGPRLKRYQARAFGRAAPILKRTTHVSVVLEGQPDKEQKPKATATTATSKLSKKDVKDSPAKAPVVTRPAVKPDSTSDKMKERSARDIVSPRKGLE